MARRHGSGSSGGGHDSAGGLRWLLTYADLITLLLAFFVIMFAMSSADQRKFNALKSSLQAALRTDGAGTNLVMEYAGDRPISEPVPTEAANKESAEFQQIIQKVQENVGDARQVGFFIDERGLTIRFLDNVLFDSGRAVLRPEARPLLDAVGNSLRGTQYFVRVEGHADNLPINTVQFPSNWELSASRSIAVTRYLIGQHKLEAGRFSSLGYGEFRPLYPNDSNDNRAKNRRVDVVILRTEKAGGEIGGAPMDGGRSGIQP